MIPFRNHLLVKGSSIRQALEKLNELAKDAILFVVDESDKLIGSLTDGDVRRGLLQGYTVEDIVDDIIQEGPRFIRKDQYDLRTVIAYREENFKIVPVIDSENRIINIINFRYMKSYLPSDAIIMAGGLGSRLKPLTDELPKPLLKVGDKPIIEHNIDRLANYGIDDFFISVNYKGEMIESYFRNGIHKNIHIEYVKEEKPLGTIGSASLIENFQHDTILIINSDLLTNLDFEAFYLDFLEKGSDMAVATVPYRVLVPYAIMETHEDQVLNFKEKPTFTYYANAGIYLLRRQILERIPFNTFFNSTDLMEGMIRDGLKVTSYPIMGYWLDIGRHEDYEKAQKDIFQIKF